jgi:hypothetical protein
VHKVLEARIGTERVEARSQQDTWVKSLIVAFFEPSHGFIRISERCIDCGNLRRIRITGDRALLLPSRKPMRILIAAIPPVRPLDVVGPVEVFGDANRMRGGDPVYSVEIVASGEEKLMDTHFQMPMLADRTYRAVAGSFDTVLVPGGDGASKMRYQPPFVDWLKRQCAGARRFGSICTGALVLARLTLASCWRFRKT